MKLLIASVSLAIFGACALGCGSTDNGNGGSGGSAGSSASTGGSATTGGTGAGTGGTTSTNNLKQLGDACAADNQCAGQSELAGVCMASWPGGGYCTTAACNGSSQCGSKGWCADDGTGTKRCLVDCIDATDCKSGYSCPSGGCAP